MATFHYRAYTERGAVTAGTIVADGLDAAIDTLYGSGLTPFETSMADQATERAGAPSDPAREAETSIWKRELIQSNRFGLKELTAFTVELASLINSGLTLDAAFRIIAGPGASPKTARLANGLLRDVLAGLQLSEAMAQRPDVFPSDYRAILAAGEAGGVTGQVLTQIAELLARRLEIRNKITSALVYPMILILMSLVSVLVIVFVLIPSISPIFVDAGLPLPGILHFFEELQDNWLIVLLAAALFGAAGFVLWGKAKQNPEIMLAADRLKCSLPVIGGLVRHREAGGFARALGTLLVARVPLMSAMQTARGLVTNRHLNALYEGAIKRVPEGTPLSRAFDGDGVLPPASLRLVAVGEESGQLGPMLIQVASVIEADLQRRIERMVGLLTPALTLLIGGSIGGLIMHVMSAVLSINNLAFQ
ncbi:type II secretion system F family protein [Bradyrhizobium sp. CB3481]|uniref:type II secretion system F family protein n=1 Tax=Bradyrhizobium sp. CB3481 TaxID=3039158 RepID=UPI0024B10214|nr:type II secretion system F family protein [Bradyrhizobium sp. CB3481]WFU18759.1 type II secretion system F family protein [Bradyrhizobium sp. CB3481]